MSRVGLDISALDPSFKAHAERGIGRYVREISRCMDAYSLEHIEIWKIQGSALLKASPYDRLISALPIGRTTIRQQLLAPSIFRTVGVDLLHFPAHIDAPAMGLPPYIVTVMDLIPLKFPDLYKAPRANWRFRFGRWLEIQSIKNAILLLAISNQTAKDLQEILHVPPERIRVTPLGVDLSFYESAIRQPPRESREKLHISNDSSIILYVGGIDQRKNWKGLIEVFSRVRSHFMLYGKVPPVLVMAGSIEKDSQYPLLEHYIEDRGLRDAVVKPGFIKDADLLSLCTASSVFFFPSLYEGFGLPMLEAMAAGVPVVSSNRSSMPEIAGEAAILVDPQDYDECTKKLIMVLENHDLADELRQQGIRRSKEFSWAKTAALTFSAYEEALTLLGKCKE